MKGVILAGGLGTRLDPLTRITNKHLLPVYAKPMIYYPSHTLVDAGICDILIVTGGNNAGDFLKLLGNGAEFGLSHINYTYQKGEGGIAAVFSQQSYGIRKNGKQMVNINGQGLCYYTVRGSRTPIERFGSRANQTCRSFCRQVPHHRFYPE